MTTRAEALEERTSKPLLPAHCQPPAMLRTWSCCCQPLAALRTPEPLLPTTRHDEDTRAVAASHSSCWGHQSHWSKSAISHPPHWGHWCRCPQSNDCHLDGVGAGLTSRQGECLPPTSCHWNQLPSLQFLITQWHWSLFLLGNAGGRTK